MAKVGSAPFTDAAMRRGAHNLGLTRRTFIPLFHLFKRAILSAPSVSLGDEDTEDEDDDEEDEYESEEGDEEDGTGEGGAGEGDGSEEEEEEDEEDEDEEEEDEEGGGGSLTSLLVAGPLADEEEGGEDYEDGSEEEEDDDIAPEDDGDNAEGAAADGAKAEAEVEAPPGEFDTPPRAVLTAQHRTTRQLARGGCCSRVPVGLGARVCIIVRW